MNRIFIAVLSSLLTTSFGNVETYGSLDLSVEFVNTALTVNPHEQIEIFATITNESSSTETLNGTDETNPRVVFQGITTGSLFGSNIFGASNPYSFVSGELSAALLSIQLPPGDSFTGLVGTLVPDPSPVAPGIYSSGPLSYTLDFTQFPSVSFDTHAGIEVTVIPEPTTATIVLATTLCWTIRRRRLVRSA